MAENLSRMNHEVCVSDEPPTTNQLFRLAAQAMGAGHARRKNRTSRQTPRTHFNLQEMHYYDEAVMMNQEVQPTGIHRLLAIRIGRKTLGAMPLKEWSLKFYDTSWYDGASTDKTGIRCLHRFEWNQHAVTLAERRIAVVPEVRTDDLYWHLEHLSIPEDAAEILHATTEMSQVTAADCEDLIEEFAEYYQQGTSLYQRRSA